MRCASEVVATDLDAIVPGYHPIGNDGRQMVWVRGERKLGEIGGEFYRLPPTNCTVNGYHFVGIDGASGIWRRDPVAVVWSVDWSKMTSNGAVPIIK